MESLTPKQVEKYTGTVPMSSSPLKCTRFVVDFGFVLYVLSFYSQGCQAGSIRHKLSWLLAALTNVAT